MHGKDIARLYQLNSFAMAKNMEGVSNELSLARTKDGSTINWIAGHILATRRVAFKFTDMEAPWTAEAAEAYNRGSTPEETPAAPVTKIMELLAETTESLTAWLATQSEEDLAKPNPDGPHEFFGDSIGDMLSALAWHEGYHVGQVGLLRRAAGLGGAIV